MTFKKLLPCIALLMLFTNTARAEVSLLGGRVGAVDAVSLAEFYKEVFGMHEVNRFVFPDGGIEVMLNFGATAAEARANTAPQVVLMPRESNDTVEAMPHLIFNVTDIHARVAALEAAGGEMTTEELITIPAGEAQILIAIARDPAGNLVELLQQPGQ